MKYFPITLIMVLSSSLFVAMVINPVLTEMYMKVEEKKISFKKVIIQSVIAAVIGLLFLALGFNIHKKGIVALGNILLLYAIFNILYKVAINPVVNWFQNSFLPSLERVYEKVLKFSLRGKNVYVMFFSTFALLFFSMYLMKLFPPNILFFPESDPEQIYVYSEFPIGTTIEKTNALTLDLENKI